MDQSIITAAKVLWNYHLLHHQLEKTDCILALGSHDMRVANRAADLFLDGYALFIIMSGGLGNFTKNLWTEKEADKFACRAIEKGVPADAILIENKSTNTGENILFTRKLLQANNIRINSLILVQKPYMERRAYATIKMQWPEPKVLVSSPQNSFDDYHNDEIPLERVINIMVGDLERIIKYPGLGFQIPLDVPDAVKQAFDFLVKNGFDKHLINSPMKP